MKKHSPKFERDFGFYLANKDYFNFAGIDIKLKYGIQLPKEEGKFEVPYDINGKSAKDCFHKLDGAGKKVPCKEPELLVEILRCKASVNLNIKMWAESLVDFTLSLIELQEYMEFYSAPDWVLEAVTKQRWKLVNIKD